MPRRLGPGRRGFCCFHRQRHGVCCPYDSLMPIILAAIEADGGRDSGHPGSRRNRTCRVDGGSRPASGLRVPPDVACNRSEHPETARKSGSLQRFPSPSNSGGRRPAGTRAALQAVHIGNLCNAMPLARRLLPEQQRRPRSPNSCAYNAMGPRAEYQGES